MLLNIHPSRCQSRMESISVQVQNQYSFIVNMIEFQSDYKDYKPALYFDDAKEFLKWQQVLEKMNMT